MSALCQAAHARPEPFAIRSHTAGHLSGGAPDPGTIPRSSAIVPGSAPEPPQCRPDAGDFWIRDIMEPSEHIAGYGRGVGCLWRVELVGLLEFSCLVDEELPWCCGGPIEFFSGRWEELAEPGFFDFSLYGSGYCKFGELGEVSDP